MTQTEAVVERIELLVNELLKRVDSIAVVQSDLLMALKPRGTPEATNGLVSPNHKPWCCEWFSDQPEKSHSTERAQEKPWEGRICRLCADREEGINVATSR